MNQASARELFSRAASTGEPPLGSLISDSLQPASGCAAAGCSMPPPVLLSSP